MKFTTAFCVGAIVCAGLARPRSQYIDRRLQQHHGLDLFRRPRGEGLCRSSHSYA